MGGCGGSKISVIHRGQVPARAITKLAIAPGSGVLGEAIGLELFNRGHTIVDAQEAIAIVGRVGLQEFEVTSTKGFKALQDKGIDAVLVAKSVDGLDGTPESASVRVTDTATGQIIAGITWQNGWGGQRGSIADRTMRKNVTEAANEIAGELARRLQPVQ
jgi:hypothetical protein